MAAPELPEHPPQFGPGPGDPATWALEIGGLVAAPARLSREQLLEMERGAVENSPVACPDGWDWNDSRFEGVSLETLLDAARPLPEAHYLTVHAGDYVASYPLASLPPRGAVLALIRDGAALDHATGGPARLVVAEGVCSDMIKWVQAIELTADDSQATVPQIMASREAMRAAKGS